MEVDLLNSCDAVSKVRIYQIKLKYFSSELHVTVNFKTHNYMLHNDVHFLNAITQIFLICEYVDLTVSFY